MDKGKSSDWGMGLILFIVIVPILLILFGKLLYG